MLKFEDDHKCFACGKDNPDGLRLSWKVEGTTMDTIFLAERKYQGWGGIVHGGILATLLDEAMTRLAAALFGPALTAEMTVRYVVPAKVGETFYVKGELVKESRRLLELKATIYEKDATGPIIAHATGKAIRPL